LEIHEINLLRFSGEDSDEKGIYQTVSVGGAVGAIVLLIVIFSAGWVVTSGSARSKRKNGYQCSHEPPGAHFVAQFMLDPNKEERLSEMNKLDSWKRGEYVQKQGWATMPGEKQADMELPMSARDVLLRSNC